MARFCPTIIDFPCHSHSRQMIQTAYAVGYESFLAPGIAFVMLAFFRFVNSKASVF